MSDVQIHQLDTEDAITAQLVQLITLCEQRGIDLELLMAEARRLYDGEPEIGS